MTIWVNSCKLLICKIHAKWHVLHSRMVSSFLNFDNVLCNTPAPPSTPHLTSLGCCDPLTVTWISDPTVTSYNVILTGSINTVISIPVRRLFKFLAIVSTTLFGISLPLATALYKTQIALVGSVAALVLSSAVFWLYTGRQMLVERSRSIAIEKETLSV